MSSADSHADPPLQLVPSRSAAAAASEADLVHGLIGKQEWAAVALWTRYGSMGVDGLQLQEVADATGYSPATVKRRLRRADAELSRFMEGEPVLVTFLRGEGSDR